MQPHEFPRRALLCVTGLSPQVVTETVYALAVQQQPPFVPTEVHIVSTAEGAHRAELMLFGRGQAHFARLCDEYGLPPIAFDATHIHRIAGADGRPLQDIRCAADNTAAADAMQRLVAGCTADEGAALHVSIAGGRKTMGYLLGYMLTLFGRPQDRLSHVLVSAPYENLPEFFYPTRESTVLLAGPDQRPVDACEAVVELVDIPFVSLRTGLPQQLQEGRASFAEAVHKVRILQGAAPIVLDDAMLTVRVDDVAIVLRPLAYAVYAWLTTRAADGEPGVGKREFNDDDALRAQLLAHAGRRFGEMSSLATSLEALHRDSRSAWNTDGGKWLGERVNEINEAVTAALGRLGRVTLGVAAEGGRNRIVYRLAPDPARLRA